MYQGMARTPKCKNQQALPEGQVPFQCWGLNPGPHLGYTLPLKLNHIPNTFVTVELSDRILTEHYTQLKS